MQILRSLTRRVVLSALPLAAFAAPAAALEYRVTWIPALPDKLYSIAEDVNDFGQVAGWSAELNDTSSEGFLFSEADGLQGIGRLPGGASSKAQGVNNDGMIAGYSGVSSGRSHAVRWTTGGGLEDLGLLAEGVGTSSYGQAINDAGIVAGYAYNGESFRASRWSEAHGWADLGALPGGTGQSWAGSINNAGDIAGFSYLTGGPALERHALLVRADGSMLDLGTLSGAADNVSVANAIGNGGHVVGQSSTASGALHAFIWSEATGMVDLGDFDGPVGGGDRSGAEDVNVHGVVVGYGSTSGLTAAIWRPGMGIQELSTLVDLAPGTSLSIATAISDTGYIAGYGQIDGQTAAFLLTPTSLTTTVPAPAAALSLLVGLGALFGLSRVAPRSTRG